MKKILMGILVGILLLSTVGCSESENNAVVEAEANATAQMASRAMAASGMPSIINWRERKLRKEIYELCDREDLICYVYSMCDMNGSLIYWGMSIGFGIPYGTQYSNPQAYTYDRRHGDTWSHDVAQPEPNGLYPAEGVDATWIVMVDPVTGETHPWYCEEQIIVVPYSIHEAYSGTVFDFSGINYEETVISDIAPE